MNDLGSDPDEASRISGHRRARRDVPRHHAAGPDDGAVANRDAGQDDRAAADPDVGADLNRTAKLKPVAPGLGIPGMVGAINLNGRADLGAVADRDMDNIEDDAVEVEKYAVAQENIVAEIAEERRADHRVRADAAEVLPLLCVV